jgi:RHS repeat-associated protein
MLALGGKNLTYDQNGNLQTRTDVCGTTTYTWDARNRLTGISGYKPDCSSLTASISYDAMNRRISKTINGTTTQFVYDGWDVIQEITSGVKTNYVRSLHIDEPLTRITGSTIRHYVKDALGSVIALADDTGATTTTYVYDAFGNAIATGEASDNPFQYTARENDGTGLYYYRARYYSPEMQRFISEDPIRLRGGINFYSMTHNDPINWTDPSGLINFNGGGGVQGGAFVGIAGANGSIGAVAGTDGQMCAVVTVCIRVGLGLYAGAGTYRTVGGTLGNTSDIGGWSVGGGGDFGTGAAYGVQGTVGSSSAGGQIGGKLGGGGGLDAGVDFCYTFTKCSKKPACGKQ